MSSTLVQGDKVTAHNTSKPAEPQHLELEGCDLLRCIGAGGLGGLVVKGNDCKAKAMRHGQGSPPRQ